MRRRGGALKRRGRFFFTPTSALVRRIIIYGAMGFLLTLIQTSLPFLSRFRGAVPNIVLVASAAVGFFDSERAGAVFGISAGCALDALGGGPLSLMPLAGFVAGYFCGRAAGRLLPRATVPFMILIGGVSALNLVLTVVCAYASVSEVRPWGLISRTLIPELIFTFIFGIPTAYLSRFCARLAGRTGRGRPEG